MGQLSYFQIIARTYKRDLRGLSALLTIDRNLRRCQKLNKTAPLAFIEHTQKNPNANLFLSHNQTWTRSHVDSYSNQIANFITKEAKLKPGDDVTVFMTSSPEYIATWLGIAKAGVVPALVNNNLKLDTLAHSISVINSKAVIFDAAHADIIADVIPLLKDHKIKYYMVNTSLSHANSKEVNDFQVACKNVAVPPGSFDVRNEIAREEKSFSLANRGFDDKLFYIYTSGTTGYPKAVIIKNSRFLTASFGIRELMQVEPSDILYTCLPLHHFAGGVMASSQAVCNGSPLAISSKFSSTHFWSDCAKFEATVSQYIGEMCRYLYAQPPRPEDKSHKLKVIFGNGMRPNLWRQFSERFNIPRIAEVYGTSEGNAQVANLDNKEGSCGFVSRALPTWFLKRIYPVSLIKCDLETGEPIRGADGLCILCEPGEIGQFVGRIVEKDPVRQFDGYSNQKETSKKIINNVFIKGDKAFASGDLLWMDELGYLYFHDRTGDTFRWKGENVSTTEVEAVLMKASSLSDVVVYGVSIPFNEGRAGMAALKQVNQLTESQQCELVNDIYTKSKKILPTYAIPVFIRLSQDIQITATLKMPKNTLQKEAFDITKIKDPVYVYDKIRDAFVKLTPQIHKTIIEGKMKF